MITLSVRRLKNNMSKVKRKVPVKNLDKENVYVKVEETLRNDPENAYTTSGIMLESFEVKEEDIHNKSFKDWKKGLPTLYGRIDRVLKRMVKEEKAKVTKDGKAWVYWWNSENR